MTMNLSTIATRANKLAPKRGISQSEAMHRSWNAEKAAPVNAQRIADAKAEAGITSEIATWKGWKDAGYTVRHGEKAVLKVTLVYATKGDGAEYIASFFTREQVEETVVA